MEMEEWLEPLLAHEANFFSFGATCARTPCAWFLDGPALPDYRDCNRALRLRDDGRGPGEVAREAIAHFQARGLPVAADVDPIAEAQGIGAALRRLGVTPIIGHRLLMRYPHAAPPELNTGMPERPSPDPQHPAPYAPLTIERIPNETGAGEAKLWVETAVSDETEEENASFWRTVAEHEARSPRCRLYLARLEGQAAGACSLFSHANWGRIDSVVTVPALRRRGIASRLTVRAVTDSLALGNTLTYLYTDAGGAGEQVYRKLGFTPWAVDILRRHIRW